MKEREGRRSRLAVDNYDVGLPITVTDVLAAENALLAKGFVEGLPEEGVCQSSRTQKPSR